MADLIRKCWTKGTKTEGTEIRRSFKWALARRGWLKVTSDALELGNWRIPYSEIDEAFLFSARSFFIPYYVLCIKSKGITYQFGLNPGAFWSGTLPFPVKREKVRVGHSVFSIAIRIVLLLWIVRWLVRVTQ